MAQFAELNDFPNVVQVPYHELLKNTYPLRGKWAEKNFKNTNPVILELGCGKGEYTIGLAKKYPNLNFIGVDIKGARIWRGAKTAIEENIPNAFFLRARIDFIESFFGEKEINEIWITFPDPQPKKSKERKRLTSPGFLNKYLTFLKKEGFIHLKTDARNLYEYSLETAKIMNFTVLCSTDNLDRDIGKLQVSEEDKEVLQFPTFYEKKFREKGHEICYLKLQMDHHD